MRPRSLGLLVPESVRLGLFIGARGPPGSVVLWCRITSGALCFLTTLQMYGIFLTYANNFRKKFKKKRKNFKAVKTYDKTQ